MKKFLLLLLGLVAQATVANAAEVVCDMTDDNWGSVSGYNGVTSKSTDGNWAVKNANNNNKTWKFFKVGGRNTTQTGMIQTLKPIADAVSEVSLTISAVNVASATVTAYELVISDDATFDASVAKVAGSISPLAVGDYSIVVPADQQGQNKYYSLNITVKNPTGTNGAISITKAIFTTTEGGSTGGEVSVAKPTIEVDQNFVVTLTSATEGASIHYTLDGTTPSATEGTLYSAPFTLTENCTISAVAFDAEGNTSAVATKAVTNIPVKITDAAAIYTLPQGTNFALTEDMVVISSVANYTVLAGANRNLLCYNQSATLPVGLHVSAVYGVTGLRNGLICATAWGVDTDNSIVELPAPTEKNIADVQGTAATDMLQYVKFTNVSIAQQGTSTSSFTMTQGDSSIALYNQYGVEVFTGDNYDVVGVIGLYNSTVQINPTLVEKHAEVGVLGDITLNGNVIGQVAELTVDINTPLTFAATNAEMISYAIGDNHDVAEGSTIEFIPTTKGSFPATIEAVMGDQTKTTTFLLNVVKPLGDLAFFTWSPTTYTYKQGAEFTAPTLIAPVDPAELLIEYTSSNAAVAAIDANGVITLGGELGRATITAYFIGDDNYNPAIANCTIIVKDNANTHYVLVDDAADVTTGTNYVLTMYNPKNIGVNYVMGVQASSKREAVDATFEDNAIFDLPEGAATFQFENSDNANFPYHILLEDGYLYAPVAKDINVTADKTTAGAAFSVAISNGNATISSSKSALKLCGTYSDGASSPANNPMFRFYATAQKPVQLYREVVTPTAATATCTTHTPNEVGQFELALNGDPALLTLTAPADHELYYSNGTATTPAIAAAPALDHTGYTKADNGAVELTIHNSGVVNYYTVKDGIKGKKQSVAFTGTTAISEITAAATSGAIYDLQGRRVSNPTRGLYIQAGRVVRF